MTVEELFRALTSFDPDDKVLFADGSGELFLLTSIGLADQGIIIQGFPTREITFWRAFE